MAGLNPGAPSHGFHRLVEWLVAWRTRLTGAIAGALVVEDLLEGVRPHELDNLTDPWGLVGLALVLAGSGLRTWAAGVLRKHDRLITGGPYAWLRHPLYAGSFLIGLGLCTILGDEENLWALLGLAAALYVPKVRDEERALAERFAGEWDFYAERTGCLWPRCWPTPGTNPWTLTHWVRNREYQALAASLCAVLLLELWHHAMS